MTETEFVLTQERIDNVEAHCASLEKDLAWHKENTTSGDWLEKRVIALEHEVRLLLQRTDPRLTEAQRKKLDKLWLENRKNRAVGYTKVETGSLDKQLKERVHGQGTTTNSRGDAADEFSSGGISEYFTAVDETNG